MCVQRNSSTQLYVCTFAVVGPRRKKKKVKKESNRLKWVLPGTCVFVQCLCAYLLCDLNLFLTFYIRWSTSSAFRQARKDANNTQSRTQKPNVASCEAPKFSKHHPWEIKNSEYVDGAMYIWIKCGCAGCCIPAKHMAFVCVFDSQL